MPNKPATEQAQDFINEMYHANKELRYEVGLVALDAIAGKANSLEPDAYDFQGTDLLEVLTDEDWKQFEMVKGWTGFYSAAKKP